MRLAQIPIFFGVIALAMFAITGCDYMFGDLYSHGDIYYYETQTPADAQKMARNATVECGQLGACPPSIGLLSGNMGAVAYQCTAFLVAPQIAVTNSHCIPQELT